LGLQQKTHTVDIPLKKMIVYSYASLTKGKPSTKPCPNPSPPVPTPQPQHHSASAEDGKVSEVFQRCFLGGVFWDTRES